MIDERGNPTDNLVLFKKQKKGISTVIQKRILFRVKLIIQFGPEERDPVWIIFIKFVWEVNKSL
jgi:hypothetical protein